MIFLTIMGVEEHGIEGEFRSNSLADVKEIEHLFNGFVSLLPHTSIMVIICYYVECN